MEGIDSIMGKPLYEERALMEDVRAPPPFLLSMRDYWSYNRSVLCKLEPSVQDDIAHNLWRYFVFCYRKEGSTKEGSSYYIKEGTAMTWIEAWWPNLHTRLLVFFRSDGFHKDVGLYSLESGKHTALIRKNASLNCHSEEVAVSALLMLMHPISKERMLLETFGKIFRQKRQKCR